MNMNMNTYTNKREKSKLKRIDRMKILVRKIGSLVFEKIKGSIFHNIILKPMILFMMAKVKLT